MKDKVILLTGGTHGIGRVVATEIAARKARLYLICPDRTNDERAGAVKVVEAIKQESHNNDIHILFADLSSQKAIFSVVEEFQRIEDRLDVLINNAAVFGLKNRVVTVDGLEMNFGLNYLSYYTLTLLLMDRLVANAPARIINVTSEAYSLNGFIPVDYNAEGNYQFRTQYAFSKLCVILFSRGLAKRLNGTGVTVNFLHPGLVFTGIDKNAGIFYKIRLRVSGKKIAQSAQKAAETYLYLACSPEVSNLSGKYFYNKRELPLNETAMNDEFVECLWKLSESLTGVTYN